MMFVLDALDLLVAVALVAGFIVQVLWPVLCDRPSFPAVRAWRARRRHRAPIINMAPRADKGDPTDEPPAA